MRFTPKTEQQIEDERFGPGTYDFEVIEAEEKQSKAGNDMIEVKLRVWNKAGGSITIRDWLLDAMPHKLRHAAEAMNLIDQYNRGEFPAARLLGKTGRVICVHNKDGFLTVKDYEKPTGVAVAARPAAPAPARKELDDEIPF